MNANALTIATVRNHTGPYGHVGQPSVRLRERTSTKGSNVGISTVSTRSVVTNPSGRSKAGLGSSYRTYPAGTSRPDDTSLVDAPSAVEAVPRGVVGFRG